MEYAFQVKYLTRWVISATSLLRHYILNHFIPRGAHRVSRVITLGIP